MDYSLVQRTINVTRILSQGLNPCCNGLQSSTAVGIVEQVTGVKCLNPCCNGLQSSTAVARKGIPQHPVLILVVMDYSLVLSNFSRKEWRCKVLILVVMDYSLVLQEPLIVTECWLCLNPCCNGLQSSTRLAGRGWRVHILVLILVVMDYSLVPSSRCLIRFSKHCLNPCCNGLQSSTENGNEEQANNIMS